ncbi:extracellular calcium-sensing receptor-like [Anguilla anguilla]|uniref:extracellular calcium-sensing receptor-like n=1 Tax=Anguilla anguilla TaxID=7936 RepID=UPI0015AB0D4D|nr:extracellular calcium-sensing receptor-like [Anguilla anguilla]
MRPVLSLCLNLALAWASASPQTVCRLRERFRLNGMYRKGDVVLGGLFEMHFQTVFPELSFTSKPEQPWCERLDYAAFQAVQTMVFAIEEINKNPDLLPNTTLGFHLYDNCVTLGVAFRAATALVSGTEESFSDLGCTGSPPVLGMVGDSSSTNSIAISSVLGLFRVPMVSYCATCSCLSDRLKYPSFFRTIPSDAFQVRAMVQILERYGWKWVGFLFSNSDYGVHAAQAFHQEVSRFGCVAFSEMLPSDNDQAEVQRIVGIIRRSTVKVVAVFSTEANLLSLAEEISMQNLTGRQWIASEAWATSTIILTPEKLPFLGGALGIAIRRGDIPGLQDFLLSLRPDFEPGNNMVNMFWEEMFSCSFKADSPGRVCTGQESLEGTESAYSDVSALRHSYNAYKAVYALAHALHDLLQCTPGTGPFPGHSCAELHTLQPWQLLHYMQSVKFTTSFGDQVSFDENGDALAIYDVMNWQRTADGTVRAVTVGVFDESAPPGQKLQMEEGKIFWNFESHEHPHSICSEPCPPGTRRAIRKGEPVCCFDCLPCADGEISNQTDSSECYRCPVDFWSNQLRDRCVPKEIEFLSFQEPLGISLTTISVLGACICGVTLSVFARHSNTPVVSYFATCSCLSDRQQYPSFFRTIPSDAFQVRAMVQILQRYGWKWVGLLFSDDDYGVHAAQSFHQEVSRFGCVAFSEMLPSNNDQAEVQRIVGIIRRSTAKVVAVFSTEANLLSLAEEISMQNLTGRQWIASEAWATSTILLIPEMLPFLGGALGIAIRRGDIPGLQDFLLSLRPDFDPGNNMVNMFWEEMFSCRFKADSPGRVCTGQESLEGTESAYSDVSALRQSYNVYKAVYALAHALHDLLLCTPGTGPFPGHSCAELHTLQPWQLLHYMQRVNFTTSFGDQVSFDKNGDALAIYDVMNWQRTADGTVRAVTVGVFDESAPPGQKLLLEEENIFWNFESHEPPRSICSEPCPPGTRTAIRKSEPVCCFDCLPCADGEISNQTDSSECYRCPVDFWSNQLRDRCVPKEIEFLSFQEPLGISLTTISVLGACICAVTVSIFARHRNTPVVKANNSELSFLLLLSLTLCFLCSLLFIGQPQRWTCQLRHAAFGISFALSISCILVKTIVVVMAFKAARPGGNTMKWFGVQQQRGTVLAFTIIQAVICVAWLTAASPVPYKNTRLQNSKIIYECAVGSIAGFSALLGYIGLLAASSFLLAFLARNLPDNFNEAKFITFSMLIFCAVWISFVPAYVSSPGKYSDAVEIFAILASSFGLLGAIFAPKCYIILLHPEKNTKKALMGRDAPKQ